MLLKRGFLGGVIVGLAFLAYFLWLHGPGSNKVELINNSAHSMESVEVMVGGNVITLNLPPEEATTVYGQPIHDGPIIVTGILGKFTFKCEIGYTTGGLRTSSVFTANTDGTIQARFAEKGSQFISEQGCLKELYLVN